MFSEPSSDNSSVPEEKSERGARSLCDPRPRGRQVGSPWPPGSGKARLRASVCRVRAVCVQGP